MTMPTNSSAAKDEEIEYPNSDARKWTKEEVLDWAEKTLTYPSISRLVKDFDGEVLMELTESDIRDIYQNFRGSVSFYDVKKLWLRVRSLQLQNAKRHGAMDRKVQQELHIHSDASPMHSTQIPSFGYPAGSANGCAEHCHCCGGASTSSAAAAGAAGAGSECDNITPPMSIDGRAMNIPPEFFKTAISLGYSFLVTWITSFVMVIVHERVPDMKRYPPLPDIFLDNVPHIPWAFHMCEITGTLLCVIWTCVCIFHKYRMVLLRRFFALAGTVFLLRCVTMLITSLSVPGTHLQCNQKDYAVDDTELSVTEALELRISRAYTIWSGLGMSIQGVRTCGDYMFSGHTVALTLLNFFITEYTPRNLYFLHTLTWLLNMFGIFFILAAHEHYSIDVFVAFYITSRLFLYYHTLANNQALMSRDSNRTRIWFPMFSYFESSVDGIIPNEYDTVSTLLSQLMDFVLAIKDSFMLTTRRFWIHPEQTTSKHTLLVKQKNAATSTNVSASTTPTQSLNSVDLLQAVQGSSVSSDTSKKDL